MKQILLLALATALATTVAQAQQAASPGAQNKSKISELQTEKKKDIDDQITNARMRADAGSKNKYSMSLSLAYQGGTIEQPLGKERPEIYGDPETRAFTDISGGIDARYRMTPNDSLSLGAAVAILTPFGGSFSDTEERTEINNPKLTYTRAFKVGETQNNFKTWFTYGTQESWDQVNLASQFGVSHTILTTIKSAPLTLGTTLQVIRNNYSNEVATVRNAYVVGLYPFLEYAFNDTYSFRTVFGYFNWRMRDEADTDGFFAFRAPSYQSIGVGVSITRDVYLYPNIQFLPEDADLEKTNVGLSTTINI
jgi:hypothetical protein